MLLAGTAAMLFVRQRTLAAACLLTAGVLVRTDLEVFNVCLAAAWLLLARQQRRVWLIASVLAGSVLMAAAVNTWAGNYGYAVLYHFTFMEGFIPHPAILRGLGIPAVPFLRNITVGARYSLENGGLWLVLALLGLCVVLLRRTSRAGFMTASGARALACCALLSAVGASTCIRFVVFPEPLLRLLAPAVATLAIVLVTLAADQPRAAAAQVGRIRAAIGRRIVT